MEDDDNSNSRNQFNEDTDQNQFVPQLRTNISRKKKQSFSYVIRNFPDALFIEILARLPVKSIFMCKSVCKHWKTLISHPSFCRFYYSILNSNAVSSRPFRILQKYTRLPNFREFSNRLGPEIHSSSEFSVLFLSSHEDNRYDQFRILDTNNGLILYRSGGWSSPFVYYICDPLTRQSTTLPTRDPRCPCDIVEGLITRVNDDHMLIDYTVVRVALVKSQSNYVNLEMFSSESGKWIGYKLPCTIPVGIEEEVGGVIHCYGALHWRVRNVKSGIHCLLAFDPYKDPKSVRLIPLPEDRDLQSEEDEYLGWLQICGECQGTLRYFQVASRMSDDYLFTMWGMKDYEKGEWCCQFKVRRSDIDSNDPKLSEWLLRGFEFSLSPLSFHPLNPNVVYLNGMYPECVVSYDVLNRRLDVAWKSIHTYECISWKITIPFMLPRWPVLVSVTKNKLSTSKESSSKLIRNLTY